VLAKLRTWLVVSAVGVTSMQPTSLRMKQYEDALLAVHVRGRSFTKAVDQHTTSSAKVICLLGMRLPYGA